MKTLGLLVGIWLVCGLVAEAIALEERPLKPTNVIQGPIALARQFQWL